MATVAELFSHAVGMQQSGNLAGAETIYRHILQLDSRHAGALHLLGVLELGRGQADLAMTLLRQALALNPGNADAHNGLGVAYFGQGQLVQALECFQAASLHNPGDADARNNLGYAHFGLGQPDRAIACYREALRINPTHRGALINLGYALCEQGQPAEASSYFRQALRLDPNDADAHNNLGIALDGLGQATEAIACYENALRLYPDHADAHNNLGYAYYGQSNFAQAAACFGATLRINPNHADAHNNLGNAQNELGQAAAAVESFQQALRLKPNHAGAHFNLANALAAQGQLAEAVTSYREAVRLQPGHAEAHNKLGDALQQLGATSEACASFRRALQISPNNANAHVNLGSALYWQGQFTEAEDCYEQALALEPGHRLARWQRCLLRLLQGKLELAWPDYEERWALPGMTMRVFDKPRWDGAPLAGKTILVWYVGSEQGLGDTLQFVRYLPLIKDLGGSVVLEVQRALAKSPILAAAPCAQIIAAGDPLPYFDVQVPLMSLPAVLGTTLATIPAAIPYMSADPNLVAHWRTELIRQLGSAHPEFKVGIAWQGNPRHARDRERSVPWQYFGALARLPGVKLVSLQKGHGTQQVTAEFATLDLSTQLDNSFAFVGSAAVLMNLDLLVTADSALAHLAGALGVPVWLALAFVPDWRWGLEREDSPWYPTMRLFRQTKAGDWQGVFDRIASELRHLAATP